MEMNQSLESDLRRGLRQVAAPPELWDRIQAPRAAQSNGPSPRFVWALALAVGLAAVALSLVRTPVRDNSQQLAFHCQNPAELRAWVKANTGFDVPMRATLPASIQLIGARAAEGRAEIAYRAGNRDAVLRVSRADPSSETVPHSSVSRNASSWVTAGQRFTLACNDPADFQIACKLCHLD